MLGSRVISGVHDLFGSIIPFKVGLSRGTVRRPLGSAALRRQHQRQTLWPRRV